MIEDDYAAFLADVILMVLSNQSHLSDAPRKGGAVSSEFRVASEVLHEQYVLDLLVLRLYPSISSK